MTSGINEFRVGVITRPHGLKGSVLVYPTTDDPDRFSELDALLLKSRGGERLVHPDQVSRQKGMVLLHFREFTDVNEVEGLRKAELYIRREDALPLSEGEYYIPDLLGLLVRTEDGRELGHLTDVMRTGANDVYEVTSPDGKSLCIPATRECILSVDMDQGLMTVHLLPGLEDL